MKQPRSTLCATTLRNSIVILRCIHITLLRAAHVCDGSIGCKTRDILQARIGEGFNSYIETSPLPRTSHQLPSQSYRNSQGIRRAKESKTYHSPHLHVIIAPMMPENINYLTPGSVLINLWLATATPHLPHPNFPILLGLLCSATCSIWHPRRLQPYGCPI